MPRDFDSAVERHQRKVHTYALYLLGNREEAADVAQEVLIKMWKHWKKIDQERLGAWLLRVTRNASYDVLRKRQSSNRYMVNDVGEETLDQAATTDADPERLAAGSEFRLQLRAALDRLDDPYKSVLILREIQGLKYQEISDILELPLNTVRVYLFRGRRRLRDALKEA